VSEPKTIENPDKNKKTLETTKTLKKLENCIDMTSSCDTGSNPGKCKFLFYYVNK
jgi:hypothetical protein